MKLCSCRIIRKRCGYQHAPERRSHRQAQFRLRLFLECRYRFVELYGTDISVARKDVRNRLESAREFHRVAHRPSARDDFKNVRHRKHDCGIATTQMFRQHTMVEWVGMLDAIDKISRI